MSAISRIGATEQGSAHCFTCVIKTSDVVYYIKFHEINYRKLNKIYIIQNILVILKPKAIEDIFKNSKKNK